MSGEHFNGLSPAETERLDILAEECAEVIKAVSKIKRHGFESRHPNGEPTNRDVLASKLGDLTFATSMCVEAGDINIYKVKRAVSKKLNGISKYLHHNKDIVETIKKRKSDIRLRPKMLIDFLLR